jgi:hypothetical protein
VVGVGGGYAVRQHVDGAEVSLMLAAIGVAPQDNGIPAADRYTATRVAARTGFAWATCAAPATVLTAADATAQPIGRMLDVVALREASETTTADNDSTASEDTP